MDGTTINAGDTGLGNETSPEPEVKPEPKPEKRGRGRPPKDPTLKEEPVKGKATSGGKAKKPSREPLGDEAIDQMARQFMGIHELAALASGLPILRIEENEARMLAAGAVAVANEYGLELSGKTGATLQLIAAMGMVYVPRLLQIKAMRDMARARQNQTVEGEVVHAGT